MNDPISTPEGAAPNPTREEMLAALFANMVIQQTNMAMMLLGKVAHPETGQFMQDIESARMFIDQLEMIEVKTKGNLSKQEDGLLKQALSALHMSFVEAVDGSGEKQPAIHEAAPAPAAPATPEASSAKPAASEAPAAEESRKKFSKKY